LAVDRADLLQTLAVASVAPAVLLLLHKELVLRAFDPEATAAMGYRTGALDLVLNLLIALVVVAAVEAVGTVLVIALMVVPAAAARLLTDRVAAMTALACLLGAAGGWLGLAVSYEVSVDHDLRLAAGATIVVVLVGLFLLAAVVAPLRRRLAARSRVAAAEAPRGAASPACSPTGSPAGPCSRRSWSAGCAGPSGCTCCCGGCPSSPWPSATPPSPGSSWPRWPGSACSPGRPPSGPWSWWWSPCSGPASGATTPAPSGATRRA